MREYIITIIGASVISGAAHILTPASWVKYVKLITGIVILSVIASPITHISNINLFSDFSIEESEIDENIQINTISTELEKRIEEDIRERIQTEFSHEATADVVITINENNEITGVKHITVLTDANKEKVISRMCEVYGIKRDEVEVYEP